MNINDCSTEKTAEFARHILGSQYYEELYAFFESTWGLENTPNKYAYRIYTARKCFNLNELFVTVFTQEHHNTFLEEKLHDVRKRTFMTQHGLSCCVPDLIDEYTRHQRFPPILIVDELVVYGQEITNVIYSLEELVCSALGNLPDTDKSIIKGKLLSAIDIVVFAREKKRPLIPDRILSRIDFWNEMSGNQWRIYIQSISQLLNCIGTLRNKSYLPLFSLKTDEAQEIIKKRNFLAEENWNYCQLKYHGISTQIWTQNIYAENNEVCGFLAISSREINDLTIFLPTFFFGDMSISDAKQFLSDFIKIIANKFGYNNRIVLFLQNSCEKFLPLQFQLVLCICSAVSFKCFLNQSGILFKWDQKFVDIDRVCMNFGPLSKLYEDFKLIFDDIFGINNFGSESLIGKVSDKLAVYASPLFVDTVDQQIMKVDFSRAILDAEDYLQEITLADEMYAAAMRSSNGVFGVTTPKHSAVSVSHYLSNVNSQGYKEALMVMLLLFEDGVASGNVQISRDGAQVQMRLKAGELARFCSIKRYYRFVPALIELEYYCDLYSYDALEMSQQFGRFLESTSTECACIADGLESLIERQYIAENSMRDWIGVDLLCGLDEPEAPSEKAFTTRTLQPWSKRLWSSTDVARVSHDAYVQFEKDEQCRIVNQFRNFANNYSS